GNFAGYHALSTSGVTGVSMILHATLGRDGSLVSASMVPTSMVAPGVPRLDPAKRAIALVRSLTSDDFPQTGAQISASGAITPSAGWRSGGRGRAGSRAVTAVDFSGRRQRRRRDCRRDRLRPRSRRRPDTPTPLAAHRAPPVARPRPAARRRSPPTDPG